MSGVPVDGSSTNRFRGVFRPPYPVTPFRLETCFTFLVWTVGALRD